MAFKCFSCAYVYACQAECECDECLVIQECENCKHGHNELNGTTRCMRGSFDTRTREYKEQNIVKKIVPEHCAPFFETEFDRYPF